MGFKGEGRSDNELNRWILSEKKVLAQIMERHGIEWEQKGTHEQHLSVLDYKKQERAKEVAELDREIEGKQLEVKGLKATAEKSCSICGSKKLFGLGKLSPHQQSERQIIQRKQKSETRKFKVEGIE